MGGKLSSPSPRSDAYVLELSERASWHGFRNTFTLFKQPPSFAASIHSVILLSSNLDLSYPLWLWQHLSHCSSSGSKFLRLTTLNTPRWRCPSPIWRHWAPMTSRLPSTRTSSSTWIMTSTRWTTSTFITVNTTPSSVVITHMSRLNISLP